jgi:hypothetical protein
MFNEREREREREIREAGMDTSQKNRGLRSYAPNEIKPCAQHIKLKGSIGLVY